MSRRKIDWRKFAFDFELHRESLKESLPGIDVMFSLTDYGYGSAEYNVRLRASAFDGLEIHKSSKCLTKAVEAAVKELQKEIAKRKPIKVLAVESQPLLFPRLNGGAA